MWTSVGLGYSEYAHDGKRAMGGEATLAAAWRTDVDVWKRCGKHQDHLEVVQARDKETVLGMDYCGKQKRGVPFIEDFLLYYCGPTGWAEKMSGIKL